MTNLFLFFSFVLIFRNIWFPSDDSKIFNDFICWCVDNPQSLSLRFSLFKVKLIQFESDFSRSFKVSCLLHHWEIANRILFFVLWFLFHQGCSKKFSSPHRRQSHHYADSLILLLRNQHWISEFSAGLDDIPSGLGLGLGLGYE